MSENEDQNLSRGLKSRHVQLIAIGGTIGTGLFLGAGAIHPSGRSINFACLCNHRSDLFLVDESLRRVVTI